jgi:tetratricopeptide (TPR) repeat protein
MARRRLPLATIVLNVLLAGSNVDASQLPTLGEAAFEGLPATVRAELERAYETARARPRDPSAVGRLAMILHAYDQLWLANGCYRAARQLDLRSLSWAYLSGVVQAELGDHAAAGAAFREALQIDREYLPARLKLAESLMRAGDLEASRAEYEALVRQFPELALAHHGLGHLLSVQGNRAAAAEHYRRAVELVPQFGAARYALALAYRDLGLGDRAQTHLAAYRAYGNRRPALRDPLLEHVRSMKGTARDLVEEAARLGRAGRLDESIALHLKALEVDPTAAQAHVNLISLYGRTGRPDKAEEHYRAVLRLEANLADAHYNYGVLLAASGRHADAAAVFRKALDVNPFHAQAHNNLGGILAQQGRLDDAAAHYRQAIANDPQHRAARFNFGRVLVASGRYPEAIEQFHRVLSPEDDNDSDTPRYMYALADAYRRAGDLQKARQYAEDARQRAKQMGQTELAATIEKALERLAKVPR